MSENRSYEEEKYRLEVLTDKVELRVMRNMSDFLDRKKRQIAREIRFFRLTMLILLVLAGFTIYYSYSAQLEAELAVKDARAVVEDARAALNALRK